MAMFIATSMETVSAIPTILQIPWVAAFGAKPAPSGYFAWFNAAPRLSYTCAPWRTRRYAESGDVTIVRTGVDVVLEARRDVAV